MTTEEILKQFDEKFPDQLYERSNTDMLTFSWSTHKVKDFIKKAIEKVERETEKRVALKFIDRRCIECKAEMETDECVSPKACYYAELKTKHLNKERG